MEKESIFKTKAGTELPLLNLKGKLYLEVRNRVKWCREEHPDWRFETEIVSTNDMHTVFKATVRDKDGNVIATGHQREDSKHFQDHLAKAETASLGRALALCGYGTQFAPEFDEGDRIVDSPVKPTKPLESPITKPSGALSSGSKPQSQAFSHIDAVAELKALVKSRQDVWPITKYVSYLRVKFGVTTSEKLTGIQMREVTNDVMNSTPDAFLEQPPGQSDLGGFIG